MKLLLALAILLPSAALAQSWPFGTRTCEPGTGNDPAKCPRAIVQPAPVAPPGLVCGPDEEAYAQGRVARCFPVRR